MDFGRSPRHHRYLWEWHIRISFNDSMMPRSTKIRRALAQGVSAAHIIDGRVPHALLLEVFTDAGIGTMVVGRG